MSNGLLKQKAEFLQLEALDLGAIKPLASVETIVPVHGPVTILWVV
jgi:hypothetical protein